MIDVGALYEIYNKDKTNGVRTYRREDGNLYNGQAIDLCESCMMSFNNWVNEVKHTDKKKK